MKRAGLSVAFAFLVCAVPDAARGDDDDQARRLFEEGTAAVHVEAWDRAVDRLERSLALSARPATAFNLVLALDGGHRLVRARALCVEVLEGHYGALDDERRGRAESVCARIAASVPHLEVSVGGASEIELRIDGEPAGALADGGRLERDVDPGRHILTASAAERRGEERVVMLGPGERQSIELRVHMMSGGDGDAWVPWVLTAGGVALVGALVAIVLAFTLGPGPVGGDFPITATLLGR